MFNPFFLLTIFFTFASILLIIYIIFYFNLIGGFNEIYWKLVYLFFLFITLIILFFIESDTLFEFFFIQIKDVMIVKDLQDIVNLSLELSLIFSLYFVIPTVVIIFFCYVMNYLEKREFISWFFIFFIIIYYFFLFTIVLNNDLFLSSWEFFNKKTYFAYDFQPDLMYIVLSYIGDFYDLFIYFIILVGYMVLINLSQKYYWSIYFNIYLRVIINFILSFILFYFFGGETTIRDCFIIFFGFISFEILYFINLFFFNLKRKILNNN